MTHHEPVEFEFCDDDIQELLAEPFILSYFVPILIPIIIIVDKCKSLSRINISSKLMWDWFKVLNVFLSGSYFISFVISNKLPYKYMSYQ